MAIEARHGSSTLKDIAKKAGVSVGVASVVINGSRSNILVSEVTRARINAIAEELRYSPNVMARGLKSVRFNSLGVAFPYPDPSWLLLDYYGTSLLRGIIIGASNSCFNVTHFHKPWRDAKHSATGFRGQGIDGFLVIALETGSDMVSGLAALGIPLVVISSPADQYGVPSVDVDNAGGVRLALDHLLALGHRRIGLLMDFTDHFDISMRRDTFLTALVEARIPIPPEYVQAVGTDASVGIADPVHWGYGAAHRLLTLPEPPTALFATTDGLAINAMEAARDLGIDVPEQLSVVGFDDNLEAKRATPPLTTLRQPFVEMGQAAAKMLIALVDGEPVHPVTHLFAPELIVRGSTAPPPR